MELLFRDITIGKSVTYTFTTGKSVVLMEHPYQYYCVCMF